MEGDGMVMQACEERGRAQQAPSAAQVSAAAAAPGRKRHAMPAFPSFEGDAGKGRTPYAQPDGPATAAGGATSPAARPAGPTARPAAPAPARPASPADLEGLADAVVRCVCAQNPLREVLYKLLAYCARQRDLREAEAFVAGQDECVHSHVEQTPHTLIRMLVDAGGLALIPLDAAGAPLDAASLAGLSADEADDLVCLRALLATKAGRAATALLDPARRLRARLAEHPHRSETYRALLSFCAQSPRSLPQIEQFFKDTPGLALDRVTSYHTLSPDYYVDRLEKCGAIVWRGAWCATQAGVEALAAWPEPASHSARQA